ncbi:zinc-binding alcohol dehydrogenase family protein [Psychromonas hadalis]|uniref:zinc-binding alcohol dehydrogenase family protein n=1 Tax=Psychromonas hadalis TaxID=211669 RepID=UPI0003B77ACB|nr:zinc-binding alcohol dehydrogenase family protein [Psychromonas hadalis]
MKTIGYNGEQSEFIIQTPPTPLATGFDLLVKIEAIAINPADYKVKNSIKTAQDQLRILGWDASGIVEAAGENVSQFSVGDHVYYAGDITRPGCYASHQLVDARIVGKAPKTLNFTQSAALPLTSITAWEALFERLKINPSKDQDKTLLVIGGAGGVGSIAIQLAKKVAGLTVIATASRPDSRLWCMNLGANHTVDHSKDIIEEFAKKSLPAPDYILCLNNTTQYFPTLCKLIAPQGMICSIVETPEPLDLMPLFSKSAGFVWEFMFTRSMHQTKDIEKQGFLLNKISELIDKGTLKTTLQHKGGKISIKNINQSLIEIEKGQRIGKTVLTTFSGE